MAKTAVKPAGRRKRGAQTKMTLALFSMMLPGLIYLIINNYIPMAGLVIAFKRFNYGKGIWGSDWAGLSNFTYLFKTQDAKNIIRNTIGYNLTFILLWKCTGCGCGSYAELHAWYPELKKSTRP